MLRKWLKNCVFGTADVSRLDVLLKANHIAMFPAFCIHSLALPHPLLRYSSLEIQIYPFGMCTYLRMYVVYHSTMRQYNIISHGIKRYAEIYVNGLRREEWKSVEKYNCTSIYFLKTLADAEVSCYENELLDIDIYISYVYLNIMSASDTAG